MGSYREIAFGIKKQVENEYKIEENRDLRELLANQKIREAVLTQPNAGINDFETLDKIARIHEIEDVLDRASIGIATKKELLGAASRLESFKKRDLEPHVDAVLAMGELRVEQIPAGLSELLTRLKRETLGEKWGNYVLALSGIKRAYETLKSK